MDAVVVKQFLTYELLIFASAVILILDSVDLDVA
jgi:hypothetical protein